MSARVSSGMSSLTFDPRGSVITLPKRPLWEPTPTAKWSDVGHNWNAPVANAAHASSRLSSVKKSRKPKLLEATHTRYETMTTAVPQGTRGSRNDAAVAADRQGPWHQSISQIICMKIKLATAAVDSLLRYPSCTLPFCFRFNSIVPIHTTPPHHTTHLSTPHHTHSPAGNPNRWTCSSDFRLKRRNPRKPPPQTQGLSTWWER